MANAMPLKMLLIKPGVNTQQTPSLLQAGWVVSQLIRFRDGMLQKMGGWAKAAQTAFTGVCRGMHGWAQINGLLDMGVGTHLKLWLFQLGSFYDLTPYRLTGQSTNPFTTTVSSASVNVAITNHGASVGDFFELGSVQYSIGGLTLTGEYPVASVVNANNFTITASSSATGSASSGGISAATVLSAASSVAISAGGSGYAVGDLIALSGGTFTTPTVLQVTNVASGAITSAVVSQPGIYSATPSNPVSQAFTSGNGSGASFTVTWATTTAAAASATPQAGGSGYAVNDTITLAGGTFTQATILKVASLSGSAVATVTVQTAGSYSVTPSNPVAQGSTSGSGSGGTFNVTWNVGVVWGLELPVGAQDTSFVTGYSSGPYGGGAYGESTGATFQQFCRIWFIQNWGEFMLACPQGGAIYQWQPSTGTGTSASLLMGAPTLNNFMMVALPQQQVIALGTNQGVTELDPMLVAWSDVGNNNAWVASATNQAGTYRIPRGSKILAALGSPLVVLIWTNEGLWLMQYQGLPFVYSFTQVGQGCGLVAPKAVAMTPQGAFWMSDFGNDFHSYQGGTLDNLTCTVRDKVIGNINIAQLNKIFTAHNSVFSEVTWFYPSLNSTEIDSYVKYNYVENLWDYGLCGTSFVRTAWEDNDAYTLPMATDFNSFLYNHETGTDADGSPMDSFAETGFMVLDDGENISFVERLIPDFNTLAGTLNLTVIGIDFPNSDSASPNQYGPFPVTPGVTPYVTCRARGRGLALKIESNTLGGNFRMGALRARISPTGKR
jgi:hypothetical protein